MLCYRNGDEFYCFTQDAPKNGYQILHVELVKTKKKNERIVQEPFVRSCFKGAAQFVGRINVFLPKPLALHDFSSYPPTIRQMNLPSGETAFDILHLDLEVGGYGRRSEIALWPGSVYGMAWQGLVRMVAGSALCENYWREKNQPMLPFAR